MAIALETSPRLILVDEVLAVGDSSFQREALDRASRLVEDGASLLLVTHDMQLDDSRRRARCGSTKDSVRDRGPVNRVVASYIESQFGAMYVPGEVHTRLETVSMVPGRISAGGPIELDLTLVIGPGAPATKSRSTFVRRSGHDDLDAAEPDSRRRCERVTDRGVQLSYRWTTSPMGVAGFESECRMSRSRHRVWRWCRPSSRSRAAALSTRSVSISRSPARRRIASCCSTWPSTGPRSEGATPLPVLEAPRSRGRASLVRRSRSAL